MAREVIVRIAESGWSTCATACTDSLDGEIVCLDQFGRSQFYELMFRRGQPFFYAFDLLWVDGADLRSLPLLKRKTRLRKLIGRRSTSRLLYLDHIEGNGSQFFAKACELELEGIVAKWKTGAYVVGQPPFDMGKRSRIQAIAKL